MNTPQQCGKTDVQLRQGIARRGSANCAPFR